jgi:nucleoside-diphosphate-sugar epimerase
MRVLVTGGTGFLGSHLVKHLLEQGKDEVRVLSRGGRASLQEALGPRGAGWSQEAAAAKDEATKDAAPPPAGWADRLESVEGSILDPAPLREAVEGCSRVYHLAGLVSRSPAAGPELMELHVEGTRRLLEECARAKVEKIVVVTTSGTVGVSKDPSFLGRDDSPYPLELLRDWPYYLSKVYQEQIVADLSARHGLQSVIVRPSLLLGPGDLRGSSTGDVRQFLERKLPGVPSGGISFVDVRDVAAATGAAMDRGRPGQSYLMTAANWMLRHFFQTLEALSGVKAPVFTLPSSLTGFGARALRMVQHTVGWEGRLSPVSLEMASCFWFVDASKSARDLGFQPRPPERTLRDTVAWLRAGFDEALEK